MSEKISLDSSEFLYQDREFIKLFHTISMQMT